MNNITRRYLLWFAQEHVEFRFQEINSLLSMFRIPMKYCETPSELQPYWVVEFENEEHAKLLTNRSISLRSCIELWGKADSISNLHQELKKFPVTYMDPYISADKSFRIEVETFCKHFTQKEKVDKLEAFEYIPFKGPANLKQPDVHFMYIEYYGTDANNPPEEPYMVFFGRLVANGLRQIIKHLSLKTRKFIGNTSMDAQLSVLMANQARVQNGDLVLDPFVGSGSLLVAAAQFGGYVLGNDIDYLMLHARTKPSRITQQVREADEGVKANMKQYNLEKFYIDVLVKDFARSVWRDTVTFDAIITDPPYGIREAVEKVGTVKNTVISEEQLKTHIPAKVDYGLASIYSDLLNFSAKHLKLSGRLVCWFPIFRADYNEAELPQHPCMTLVANSEQVLNKHTSRRLLTYEKVENYSPEHGVANGNNIKDFRAKYYETRKDTRKECRTRKAERREQDRLDQVNQKSEEIK